MEKFQEYLIDNFKQELDDIKVLAGIPVGDRKNEAEENRLSGYVSIEKLIPFIKKSEEVLNHILNPLFERKEGTEKDKEIERNLPEIFQHTRNKDLKEEIKQQYEDLKEFEDLDDDVQQTILERVLKYYQGDLDRFYKEPRLLAAKYKIKMTKEKLIELVNKKILGDVEEVLPENEE